MGRFTIEGFVDSCVEAVRTEGHAGVAVKEVLERAVSTPAPITATVGWPTEIPLFSVWHRSDELTVLHVVWPPTVDLQPHDHQMWAAIGLYGGREDNRFYRRLPDDRIETSGDKRLRSGDTVLLGHDVIHTVANPSSEWTAAIHVYGGDYFATPRRMWPTPGGTSVAFDTDRVVAVLDEAAARARAVPADRSAPGSR